jgi:hypothetical protein
VVVVLYCKRSKWLWILAFSYLYIVNKLVLIFWYTYVFIFSSGCSCSCLMFLWRCGGKLCLSNFAILSMSLWISILVLWSVIDNISWSWRHRHVMVGLLCVVVFISSDFSFVVVYGMFSDVAGWSIIMWQYRNRRIYIHNLIHNLEIYLMLLFVTTTISAF